jgi:hypothetical protein
MLEQRSLLLTASGANFISGVLAARQLQSFTLPSTSNLSLGDAIFVAYAGPALGAIDVTLVAIWLLNLILFLFLVSPLIGKQSNTNNDLILLRIASRKQWLAGILSSVFIAGLFYVSLIMMCALLGISLVQGWRIQPTSLFQELGVWMTVSDLSFVQIWGMVWILLLSSYIAHGFLLIFLALRLGNIIWALLFIVVFTLLTWQVGAGDNVYTWQVWLPAAQSIVSRHFPFEERLPAFTITFSLTYNVVASLCCILAAVITVQSLDFTRGYHDRE